MGNKSRHSSFGWISFIFEKIDNNWIPPKCRFWSLKFQANLEALRHKWKNYLTDKKYQILKNSKKIYFVGNLSNLDDLFTRGNWIYPTNQLLTT